MMELNENNIPIVKTLADLKESQDIVTIYVFAICPKCKTGWSSIRQNAKKILLFGCLSCRDCDWDPEIDFIKND